MDEIIITKIYKVLTVTCVHKHDESDEITCRQFLQIVELSSVKCNGF